MLEEIYNTAREICGTEEGNGLIERLCVAAYSEFSRRLKDGVKIEDCKDCFETACALFAAAMYSETISAGETSYTAGQVSVSLPEGISVKALKTQAESMIAPYIADSGFEFIGVRG